MCLAFYEVAQGGPRGGDTHPPPPTNSFNKYFVNIGPDLASNIKHPTPNSYKTFLKNPASSRFCFELVNENTVSEIMDNVSTKKSCGIDELSTHLIKSIKSEILGPLTITINQSLVTGIFPNKLKIAKVTPIFKKGDPTVIENYRPISLYQHYQKFLSVSSIIKSIITLFPIICIMSVNMASTKKHSTELAALNVVDPIINRMELGHTPITVYVDLSKAFDTLDHSILINKPKYYGIRVFKDVP